MAATSESISIEAPQIPEGWKEIPLFDITEKTAQLDPRKAPSRIFKYVDVSAISSERLTIFNVPETKGSDAPSRARKVVQTNDVIFATVRPGLRRIALIPESLDGQLCSTAFCVLRSRHTLVDPKFLFFAVIRPEFVAAVVAHQRGSSYPAVTDKQILSQIIQLASLPEQRRIAQVLRKIHNAIEKQEILIAATRKLKRSLMDYLFTYGVVPTTEAPSLPVKQTDFGAMPSHWQEISIGELFHVQLGKMLSPKSQIGLSPLPYLRNANVQWGRCNLANLKAMDFDLREREKFRLLPGDLLICEGGDVGRTAMWRGELRECYFQKAIHRLRPKSDNISPTYFMYWMMELFLFRRYPFSDGTKTTIPHLPAVKLKAMCLPLPPKSEQDEIARILTAVDRKLDAEQQRLKALRGIFDSALHHLMTGKIRIPESLEV